MKKKLFDVIIIFMCLFLLLNVIVKKYLVFESISYALNLWVNNLIPTLFPFFIISDILINYNFTNYIPNFFRKICKYLLNISDNMITILFLSMISGFPSNARNTRILYDDNEINLDEANHILIFSHFSNPLFILTTIGIFFFNNKAVGLIILISHYLSNFLLAILFRNYFVHQKNCSYIKKYRQNNFGKVFINAIKRAIDTTLLICGIVSMFMLLSAIFNNTFSLNSYNSMLIKGIFEITIGIEALSKLSITLIYKAVIASCFLAFGGLSVHIQVLSQIIDTDINYKYFFIGRIFQSIISGFLTYFICILYL